MLYYAIQKVPKKGCAILSVICILGLFGTLVGCGNSDSSVTPIGSDEPVLGAWGDDPNDIDDDGLTDLDETNIYGTNPRSADTDGDGFSDFNEIIERNFDPDIDPYTFNPLIADTPVLSIKMLAPPTIALVYEESEGTGKTITNTSESTTESSVGTTQTSGLSTAVESMWSVTAGAEYKFSGTDAGLTVKLEGTVGRSTTREESFQWTDSQEITNSKTVTNGQAYEQTHAVITSGGYIALPVSIKNEGSLAFTVDNLVLSANELLRSLQEGDTGVNPIANLEYDTPGVNAFPYFTLGPGQEMQQPLFFKADLDLGTTKALLKDSSNLNVGIASYQISNFDGRPFGFENETIKTSTANIVIDFSAQVSNLSFLVATRIDDDNPGILLGEVMRNILKVDFETGPDDQKMLFSVTDRRPDQGPETYENDISNNQFWTVLHSYLEGGYRRTRLYRDQSDFDFAGLELNAQDVIYIMYVQDDDGDGLGNRQEFLYGSDPTAVDTDGDGWSDDREVLEEGTLPNRKDTDGDGLADPDDDDPLNPPAHSSSVIVEGGISVEDAQDNTYVFTIHEDGQILSSKAFSGETVTVTVTTEEPVATVTLDGSPMQKVENTDTSYTLTKGGLTLGQNTFPMEIISEDGASTTVYSFILDSVLQDVDNLDVFRYQLNDNGTAYGLDVKIIWGEYMDSRADGAVLLYRHGSAPAVQLEDKAELHTIKDHSSASATEFSTGEKAVKLWEGNPDSFTGSTELSPDYFSASYFNLSYAFRVVTYAWDSAAGVYHFSSGLPSDTETTPWPSKIRLDSIRTEIQWNYKDHAEDDPEFIINENLANAEEDFLQDLATRSDDKPWKPDDGYTYDHTHIIDDDCAIFEIPDDKHAELFRITYDVDEDEPLGEHDFVDSLRRVQLVEKQAMASMAWGKNTRIQPSLIPKTTMIMTKANSYLRGPLITKHRMLPTSFDKNVKRFRHPDVDKNIAHSHNPQIHCSETHFIAAGSRSHVFIRGSTQKGSGSPPTRG